MRGALVALALVSGSWLGVRLAAPEAYERPSVLEAVLDGGKMEAHLEGPVERDLLLAWIRGGASPKSFPSVRSILDARCASCHFEGASFDMLPLDDYDAVRRAAEPAPVLREKIGGGTMGKYLEERDEQERLFDWIDAGAPESVWPEIRVLLEARCVACHGPDGVAGLVRLDSYENASRLAEPPHPLARGLLLPGLLLATATTALVVSTGRSPSG